MAIITLTTDFGYKDYFVAAVKGAIYKELPNANIVDISHHIKPFNAQECAYVLRNAYKNFAAGSIHIIGVNSAITVDSEPVVVRFKEHYFISANNGILSLIFDQEDPEDIAKITLPNMRISSFACLDIFCPVACHIARGGTLEVVSQPLKHLKQLKSLSARVENNGSTITGNIIYIDQMGNVVCNITQTIFEAYRNGKTFEIIVRRLKLKRIYHNYQDKAYTSKTEYKPLESSQFFAIFNAAGYLELSIFKGATNGSGSAATLIGLKLQDTITINFL